MNNLVPASWKGSMDDLRDGVIGLFDRWRHHHPDPVDEHSPGLWPMSLLHQGGPPVDLEETDTDVVVTAELPGLDKKDFKVDLQGGRLILSGEKKASHDQNDQAYHYTERRYGAFNRAIPLPCEIDADNVSASYKRGVLRVTLPKTEAVKATRVQVKVT
ncbi:MAG: Hsp20/alpha crystallin family protein [bacterium]|nr:Hsp20/alpha crystallin family protein [bacterium]